METLQHGDKEKSFDLPVGYEGVKVVITENHDDDTINLTYGPHSINFTVDGARELALTLRQAANKVSKEARIRMNIK